MSSFLGESSSSSTSGTVPQRGTVDPSAYNSDSNETIVDQNDCDHQMMAMKGRHNDHYWLRELDRIDYKERPINSGNTRPVKRRPGVCSKCFRKNSQDIHLDLQKKTHSTIDLLVGDQQTRNKKVWINIFETVVNEKTGRHYARKICRELVEF